MVFHLRTAYTETCARKSPSFHQSRTVRLSEKAFIMYERASIQKWMSQIPRLTQIRRLLSTHGFPKWLR